MAARLGAGTVVEVGSTNLAGSPVYTVIASITNFTVTRSRGEIEVTNLGSTQKEFIGDLVDNGTATLTVFYDPNEASQNDVTGLEALFNSGAVRAIRWRPAGSPKRYRVDAYVSGDTKNFEPSAPMRGEFPLRLTGAVTTENV